MGFTKLFGGLVYSTVWREPMHIRVVWITMLALSDRNGFVAASLPGLADAARVSLDQAIEAIGRLGAPDEHSRTKEHDGRRIAEVDGGWLLLNYAKYRENDGVGTTSDTKGYTYFVTEPGTEAVKIGFSVNPWARLATLRTANPRLVIAALERSTMAHEKELHRQFSGDRIEGEWFRLGDALTSYIHALPSTTVATSEATGSTTVALQKQKQKQKAETKKNQNEAADAARPDDNPMGQIMQAVRDRLYVPDGKPPEGWTEGRCASIAKRKLKAGTPVGEILDAIEGLALLRDRGELEWLKRGEKVTLRALYHTRSGAVPVWTLALSAVHERPVAPRGKSKPQLLCDMPPVLLREGGFYP